MKKNEKRDFKKNNINFSCSNIHDYSNYELAINHLIYINIQNNKIFMLNRYVIFIFDQ